MNQPALDFSVIIVSWNTCDLLRACLSSVFTLVPPYAFEVFVVDNASSDGSAEMVRREFPAATLIQNHENLGFARANNQAMCRARGSYFLLLNPDAQLLPGTVAVCWEFLEKAQDVAVTGVELHNPDGTLQVGYFELPISPSRVVASLLHPTSYYVSWMQCYRPQPAARQVDWVSGSFMCVRARAARQVGLLDERFFIFGEETEWCTRFRKAGWAVFYLSNAAIVHHHHQSTRQAPREIQAHALKGRQMLYWTHFPGISALLISLHALGAGVLAIVRGCYQLLSRPSLARGSFRLGWRIITLSMNAVLDRQPRYPRLEHQLADGV